jgi:glyoxylase-like metal-dependent hydrolase (beta-lactamase superfamily II)
MVMIDTGYGLYQDDVRRMLADHGLGDLSRLSRIYLTHVDADHCGAAGLYSSPSFAHLAAEGIIAASNRAYGSVSEGSVLEAVYTKLIALFSEFHPPSELNHLGLEPNGIIAGLDIIDRFIIEDVEFQVLNSLGGHLQGQVFFFAPAAGVVFTGDSLINFSSLSEERTRFNLLAKNLMTSVNVDSKMAEEERKALTLLVSHADEDLRKRGRALLICGGHGAASRLKEGRLVIEDPIVHYGKK